MSEGKFPLGRDYVENVAERWPELEHAQAVLEHLPKEFAERMEPLSEEFLMGFVNAIAVVHDLAIKPLMDEIRVRYPSGMTDDPRDILVTKVGTAIEGFSYLACKELLERPKEDEKWSSSVQE